MRELHVNHKAKFKANSDEERIKLWHNHFKELYGKPPNITKTPNRRIIDYQLNIETGPFTMEELVETRKKVKRGKACPDDNVPPEVWATGYFDEELLLMCNLVYDQQRIQRWTEGTILPFPKKGDLGLPTN